MSDSTNTKLLLSPAILAVAVKPLETLKITVIVRMLYLFNSKSLPDIIRMYLYGNSKENKLMKQYKNLPNTGINLFKYGKEMAFHWFQAHLIRLYEWECKFIYKDCITTLTKLEAELSCFIHWVLISDDCISSRIKSRIEVDYIWFPKLLSFHIRVAK